MKYKLSSTNEARTTDYIGTVTNLHDSDLERIRQNVKLHNSEVRATSRKHGRAIGQLRRVRIMPRGPRAEASATQTHPTPVSYTHLTLPTICSV